MTYSFVNRNINISVNGEGGRSMEGKVRKAYVSGQFYDADPKRLAKGIDNMATPRTMAATRVRAVILPHAGYVYSGATAVKTLALAGGSSYSRIVVAAPSHSCPIRGLALSSCEYYATPLGNVKVDSAAVSDLLESGSGLIGRSEDAHAHEHALEVELPIAQRFFPSFELLPLICGYVSVADARELAKHLSRLWSADTLWIISSDFTHYGHSFRYVPFTENVKENIRRLDMGAADLIRSLDLEGFAAYIEKTGATICGANPIKLLLAMIELSGTEVIAELADYTTSGELTGDYSHCVSYAGISFRDR